MAEYPVGGSYELDRGKCGIVESKAVDGDGER
jgi:hypothetical protein